METCLPIAPTPTLPPCQAPASSMGNAETNGKEQCPEGEFALLLAELRTPQADKAAAEICASAAVLLVPAGLQPVIQFAVPAGAGGDTGSLPAAVPAWRPESGNALPLEALSGLGGKQAAASDTPAAIEPAPAEQSAQAEHTKSAPPPGGVTAAETTRDGLSSTFELPPAETGEVLPAETRNAPAAAKAVIGGTQPSLVTPPEGKPAGGPEQEKSEARPADSSAQPSVRPVWPAQEQLQAEAVRRLQAVKSAVLEQVLEKMVFSRSESGEAKVFVRLKPPSLGEVEISLYLEDGRLTGRIVAENAMVRELLDASLSQLRQRLEEQHVHVAELTISTGQEREFRRGRDRPDGRPSIPAGREVSMDGAGAVTTAPPGLLNVLA